MPGALAAQGGPVAGEEASTLPIARRYTVASEHAGHGHGATVHCPEGASAVTPTTKRRAADEARAIDEPIPGGPAALVHADGNDRERCPVQ